MIYRVKTLLEEISISELASEQVETLCAVAEKAARDHILSEVPARKVTVLNITVDTEGSKPITVNVELELTLSSSVKNHNAKKLADEATKQAFSAVEAYLRELACKSER